MRSTSSWSRRRRCSVFCASAWLFQKSGWAMRASSAATSSRGLPASKIPPQLRGSLHQVVMPTDQFVELECHGSASVQRAPDPTRSIQCECDRLPAARAGAGCRSTRRAASRARRPTRRRRRCAVESCGRRGSAPRRSRPSARRWATSPDHAAVGIDDAADAGVGRAHEVAALLDRPHDRLPEVLVRRGRVAVPRVVGDRREQLAAASTNVGDEVRVHHLVADGRRQAVARRPASPRPRSPGEKSDTASTSGADEEQQALERHELAERHQVHLAVDRGGAAVGRQQERRVVEARAACPARTGRCRRAARRRVRARRRESRRCPPASYSNRNGVDDSGQRTSVAPLRGGLPASGPGSVPGSARRGPGPTSASCGMLPCTSADADGRARPDQRAVAHAPLPPGRERANHERRWPRPAPPSARGPRPARRGPAPTDASATSADRP